MCPAARQAFLHASHISESQHRTQAMLAVRASQQRLPPNDVMIQMAFECALAPVLRGLVTSTE
eukprot:2878465-Rhodomonas_salina.1